MMDDDSPHADNVPISVRMALRMIVQAPDSYGFVLCLLLVSFILAPLAEGLGWLWIRVPVQGTTMLFALHTSRVHRRTMRLASVLFAVAMVLALALVSAGGGTAPAGMLEAVIALLLAVSIPAILRRILTTEIATLETIIGALDVYIIFGLFFAAVYAAIGAFSATPFFGTQAHVTGGSYQFFSFVTLTTVGYGNLVPATQLGQSLAVLEALLGQIYLVTLVARLVSGFQRGTRRRDLERLAAERTARRAVERDDVESDTDTSPTAAKTALTNE
jgi:voltage-gated potassium channel Kch